MALRQLGNPISPPAQRIEQPFLWNGAYGYGYISFTGLYHVGAREYDPRTARWLQRDPIDVAGGHPNVYLYCGNDSLNRVDPLGRQDWCKEPIATVIFTGSRLKFYSPQGKYLGDVPAYSGMPLSSPLDQTVKDKGPIPAGTYWIDPSRVEYATLNPVLARFGSGYFLSDDFPYVHTDWGEARVELLPDPATNTFGRSGFYIHGGRYIGSAGCIDVGPNARRVIDALADEKVRIKVVVIYTESIRVPYNYGSSPPGREGQVPWNPENYFRPTYILAEDQRLLR